MTAPDTIRRVARPRGVLSEDTLLHLTELRERLDFFNNFYRQRVVEALDEGSFSTVAEATGLSKDTLQRWKREAGR